MIWKKLNKVNCKMVWKLKAKKMERKRMIEID
jgi:hypothetical protein